MKISDNSDKSLLDGTLSPLQYPNQGKEVFHLQEEPSHSATGGFKLWGPDCKTTSQAVFN